MSLLLDALRRASASREEPKSEHYTVPRRAAEPAPPSPDEPVQADESGAVAEDGLVLAPRDDPPESESHAHTPASPDVGGTARDLPPPRPAPQERETAEALLDAGSVRPRGRLPFVLGLAGAAGIALVAVAGGGWLWYQESREQIASELDRYQPQSVPAETASETQPAVEAEAGSLPTLADAQPVSGDASGAAGIEPETSAAAPERAADAEVEITTPSSDESVESSEPEPEPEPEPAPNAANDAANDAATADAPTADAPEPAEPPVESSARGDSDGAPEANGGSAPQAATESAAAEPAERSDASPSDDRAATSVAGNASSEDARASSGGGDAARSESRPATGNATPRQVRPMIQVARGAPLTEALQIGYRSLRNGELATARTAYDRALQLAPDNRDALLGAAVLRQRQGAQEAARDLYRRVLDAHPRDPYARAALTALDGSATRQNESELKLLLRENPTAPALNVALGNLYASESRWSDARQAYARAREVAPEDPDYAYNLAVALDHLGQRAAARTHYQRALDLADGAVPEFRPAAVRRRLQQLR